VGLFAAWTSCAARGLRWWWLSLQLAGNWLERRVAAASAELHSFRKARVTLGAHHDHERRRIDAVFAVETAAARRRQLIAGAANLELRFDDLLGHVAANLDDAFVVRLARFRHAQNVLARSEGSENH